MNLFRFRNVFAVAFLTGAFATIALAHNKFMKSEPANGAMLKTSPARVEMWFEEKPDLTVSRIVVKGPAGDIAIGPVRASGEKSIAADFKGGLADGEYVVSWQTAGDDSHVSKGQFSFSVKSRP